MSWTIQFVGGSLGGRTEAFPARPASRLTYPVHIGRRVGGIPQYAESAALPSPAVMHVSEEYEMHSVSGTHNHLVYRWVRPDIEGMREKISRLQADLDECRKPPPRQGLVRFSR